ncbi:polysaccharide biosynthesis/export family protein [Chitinophaga sp.]|uniref:polysaccharide biosynthesis/export family protein n=1 Tax=Chitinophaga sp. TaxID=1869181 RepID=UPI0025BDEF05|nr:polysaccharide biosynthesis/export family protein [Chitinophaga sp.]
MVNLAAYSTPVIQPDDILQITVQTMDPTATAIMNQQNVPNVPATGSTSIPAPSAAVTGTNVSGYLVDKAGTVSLPMIGKLEVKGKTTDVVRDEIQTKVAAFYKDPVVNVRFANFKITVLGEVARPSSYIMPNEKVTVLDALGVAGDLTIYGKRENVLLIRKKNDQQEFVRLNLNESRLFASPYYYLQQGDVIYVEPNKSKVTASDGARLRNITIASSVISVLIVLLTRVKF